MLDRPALNRPTSGVRFDGGLGLDSAFIEHRETRLAVLTARDAPSLADNARTLRKQLDRLLPICGGVLLRGFAIPSLDEFQTAATTLAGNLLRYEFASTPRSKVTEGVYTSTEYPADRWIPQHNEQSYTLRWPLRIGFLCITPAEQGGETPVTDSRATYARLDPAIRDRFADRRLMYVRNYGNGIDLSWQSAFGTTDRAEVEAFCREQRILYEWVERDHLRTRQICQAVSHHPATGEAVWFNQAHLFHVSALDADIREALLDAVDEADLPRNVCYADGSPIEDGVLDAIRAEYAASLLRFSWQAGDLLFLDNMLMAHGRAPFQGARKVLVAMAGAHSDTLRVG